MMNFSFKNLRTLLLLLCVLHAANLCAQNAAVTERNVSSAIFKKEVKYFVQLPEGYQTSKKRYAVLYALQGSAKTVEEAAAIAQKAHQDEGHAEVIVVGIGSDDDMDRMSGTARTTNSCRLWKKNASLNGAYNNNNIPEVNAQMTAFAQRLETQSGGGITARYRAFDDWGISPQPGLYEGLLLVGKKETAAPPKAPKLTMQQTQNGKWVIMDSKKTVLYDVFIYDNGPDYAAEGLIRVVKNGKIGYADAKTFVLVIEPQFDCAFPFENGKAKVSNQCKSVKVGEYSEWQSDNWKFVDKKGKF